MVYAGDTLSEVERRRRAVAIEPMTCAPDAFNSGDGVIVLEPEEVHVCSSGIGWERSVPGGHGERPHGDEGMRCQCDPAVARRLPTGAKA